MKPSFPLPRSPAKQSWSRSRTADLLSGEGEGAEPNYKRGRRNPGRRRHRDRRVSSRVKDVGQQLRSVYREEEGKGAERGGVRNEGKNES